MKPSLKTCCRVQGTNAWYPLDSVRDLLDANPTGYKAFDSTVLTSQNDGSSKSGGRRGADAWPRPPPPGFKDPQSISKDVLRNLVVFLDGQLTLLKVSRLIEEMIGQHRLMYLPAGDSLPPPCPGARNGVSISCSGWRGSSCDYQDARS